MAYSACSFVAVHCMNFIMFLCVTVTLKLSSLRASHRTKTPRELLQENSIHVHNTATCIEPSSHSQHLELYM